MTEDRVISVYRERAARLARRAAPCEECAAGLRVLVVRVGEERLAIDLKELAEVIGHADCVPAPGSPGPLAGVINLRGEIRPVWDLGRLLGIPGGRAGGDCIVFLRRPGAAVGLRVDRVDEIRELAPGVTPDLLTLLDPQKLLNQECS